MPYTDAQIARTDEIFNIIEGRKTHEYAAPTYKDSPLLAEMTQIALSNTDEDIDALCKKLSALWYICECYDKMCRPAMSAKLYPIALSCHVKRKRIMEYGKREFRLFEDAFYGAVKARNYYESDECLDLLEIVRGELDDDRVQELYTSAKNARCGLPKYDPVEKTDEYLAVIDEVERLIDENKTMDFCLEYWSLKGEYLAERGIYWRSPALLNPGVMFD